MRKQGNHWNFSDVFLNFLLQNMANLSCANREPLGFFCFFPPYFVGVDEFFLFDKQKKLASRNFFGPSNWIHIPPIKGHGLLRLFDRGSTDGREKLDLNKSHGGRYGIILQHFFLKKSKVTCKL